MRTLLILWMNWEPESSQFLVVFTSVCQPCDVGIMKPFKTRFTTLCQDWKVAEQARLGGTGKIPASSRGEVLQWLNIAWRSISDNIIQDYFRKCGFTEDQDINIDVVLDLIQNLFQIKVCSCYWLKLFWKYYEKKNEEKKGKRTKWLVTVGAEEKNGNFERTFFEKTGARGGALTQMCDNPLPFRAFNCQSLQLAQEQDVNPRDFRLLVYIELRNTKRLYNERNRTDYFSFQKLSRNLSNVVTDVFLDVFVRNF